MYLYDSLDLIPYKTFIKISETGNFKLLSDTETDQQTLISIWEKLFKEHLDLESTPESKKEFRITNDVESLETEYKFILGACDCLEFAIDDELIEILRGKRYQLRTDNTENYYNDLGMIKRFAKGLKIKINSLIVLKALLKTPAKAVIPPTKPKAPTKFRNPSANAVNRG